MRIDVDEQLEKQLDIIKKGNWLHSKGHTETVRYLVRKYNEHESLEKLIDNKLSDIENKIENSILGSFRKIITNLLQ